jgi:hypothetical protein
MSVEVFPAISLEASWMYKLSDNTDANAQISKCFRMHLDVIGFADFAEI